MGVDEYLVTIECVRRLKNGGRGLLGIIDFALLNSASCNYIMLINVFESVLPDMSSAPCSQIPPANVFEAMLLPKDLI